MKELKINIPTNGKEIWDCTKKNAKKLIGVVAGIGLVAGAFALGAKTKNNDTAGELDADFDALPEALPEAETEAAEEEDFGDEIEDEEESEEE